MKEYVSYPGTTSSNLIFSPPSIATFVAKAPISFPYAALLSTKDTLFSSGFNLLNLIAPPITASQLEKFEFEIETEAF